MTTQHLHTALPRSSGHKEPTEEHITALELGSKGEGGNPDALLQRIISHDTVTRAALFDHDDFLCVASSTKRFNVEPDDIRKILDGLLTYSRVGDPTFAHGDGPPPTNITIGSEGKASVSNGDGDKIIAQLNGKTVVAARTATLVVLAEGDSSLPDIVQSFIEGLQAVTL